MSEFLAWHGWIDLTVGACFIGLAFAGSFVVRYHVRTGGAWHRTREGRWMLYGRLLIASVLLLTLINYFFPGYAARRFVSFLLISAYTVHLYWPHLLLSRAHRDRDREPSGGRAVVRGRDS